MTTETTLSTAAVADVMAALSRSQVPDVHWLLGDDLCDCMFQKVYETTNPYLPYTERVRLCCTFAPIYTQYPQFVQQFPAFYDENRHRYETTPAEWDSEEAPMPVYLWIRQTAMKQGISVAEARAWCATRDHERPGPVPKGTGRESRIPTQAEVDAALQARLRLSGWTMPRRMPVDVTAQIEVGNE